MTTDNSKFYEEKFQEGYNERCREIELTCLVLIENELYELTSSQRFEFYTLLGRSKSDRYEKDRALDYIRENCKMININTAHFNY